MEGASAHAPSCGPSRHSGSKDAYSADPLHRLPHAAAPLSKDPPPECRVPSSVGEAGRRPLQGDATVHTPSCFGLGGRATSRQAPRRRHRTVATISQALIRDETRCLLGSGVMRAGDLLEASRERMEGASAHAPSCGPSRHSGSKDAYSADPLHRLPHAAAPLSKDPPPECRVPPSVGEAGRRPFRETPPCTHCHALASEGVRPAPTSAPHRRHRTVATTSQALIRDETRCLLGSGVMRAGDLLEASRERMEGASAHAPSCGPSRHSGSKDAYSADPLHRLPHAAAPLSKDPPPECRVPSSVGEAGRRPLQGDATVHTLSCFGLGGRATSADKRPAGGTGRSQQPHKR
ncbi:MAG: hypothetical protein WDW38_010109 [Sanguina aurantia]